MLRVAERLLFLADPCKVAPKHVARHAGAPLERTELLRPLCRGSHPLGRRQLLIQPPQFAHDVVDQGRPNRQVAKRGSNRVRGALDRLSSAGATRGGRTAIGQMRATTRDLALEPADTRERAQDGVDSSGLQLASVGQQNELGCGRFLSAHGVSEGHERLPR